MNELIRESLTCPVCLDVCYAPITQCINGHIVCSNCRKKISRCELCKSQLSKIPNPFADELSQLVTLPCKFSHHGCEAVVEQGLMEKHMKECPFKICCQLKHRHPTNEKWTVSCEWIGAEINLLEHILKTHRGHGVKNSSQVDHSFPIRRKFDVRFLEFENLQFWSIICYDFKTHTMHGMTFCLDHLDGTSQYDFTYTLRPQDCLHDIVVQGNVMSTRGLNPDLMEYFLTDAGPTVIICQGQATMRSCLKKNLATKEGKFDCRLTLSRK